MTKAMPPYMFQGSPKRPCSIEGCPGYHAARGLCMRHYCRIVRRGQTNIESPGDFNPEAGEKMSEDEFCTFKDYRAQGFSMRDIAFELEKHIEVIRIAWECESFSQYKKAGREVPWPNISDL